MQQKNDRPTMKILIFDASSGVSGDMTAAALLDLCEDKTFLQTVMAPLEPLGYTYCYETVEKAGVKCLNTRVIKKDGIEEEDHHTWSEIQQVIDTADLNDGARALAISVYDRIAEAECAVHGTTKERIHFHEVGSMASIMNVIAFAAAYDHLGIQKAYVPCLYEGNGTVDCAHGTMDVPVPAVKQLLKQADMSYEIREEARGEIMTPTGCACVLSVTTSQSLPAVVYMVKTGYGAGKRDTGLTGYLKVTLAEMEQEENMDDSNWKIQLEKSADKIIETAERLGKPCFIAIDGRCASGKTTLAAVLNEKTGCPVVHLDDFFLRPIQRTPERYAEPGGNVDRERLLEEVIQPLEEHRDAVFQKFDCTVMELGETITIPYAPMIVFEGSYSLHPALRDHFHLKVFMDVDSKDQLDRIEKRNGPEKRKVFEERWIPLEEKYFSHYRVSDCADLIINTSN